MTLSELDASSLLYWGISSAVVALVTIPVVATEKGRGILRRLPSFDRLAALADPDGEASREPAPAPAGLGEMSRVPSIMRLESMSVTELPPSVRSAISRASSRM